MFILGGISAVPVEEKLLHFNVFGEYPLEVIPECYMEESMQLKVKKCKYLKIY